ncbi:MAG: hypothetical protein ACRC2T_17815 [Thermoguttaceae bacterium]
MESRKAVIWVSFEENQQWIRGHMVRSQWLVGTLNTSPYDIKRRPVTGKFLPEATENIKPQSNHICS